ncbi:hypothetical protein LSH36_666g01017 [Paralvinella palmiformis]|uniref:Uncharacterized protein n=1 Tax=Paralvinella palmiformis TaxID=53620 RepID=A0AAD9MWJ9_9ANNE|nr:hypothetical protein LSH36_666g01017 [Paralvinella palmiformis]
MKGTGFSCRSAKELKQKKQQLCSEVKAKFNTGILTGDIGEEATLPTAMPDDVKTVGTKAKDLRTNTGNNEAPTSKKLKLTIDEEILMISKKQNSIIKEGSKTISSLLVQLNTLFKELVSVQTKLTSRWSHHNIPL